MILNKNIKEYCQEKKMAIKKDIEQNFSNKEKIIVAAIQVGNDSASKKYIENKRKDCKEVGINFEWYYFEEDITENDLIFEIKEIQKHVNGIIVQLPLPSHIDFNTVKLFIDPLKDLDGFNQMTSFSPCTPKGIIDYMEQGCGFDFEGKHIVVIGRSEIVGKPLAKMLIERNATVTVCHSKTKYLDHHIYHCDAIICAVGKRKFLNCYSIHIPVIDVGINFNDEGEIVGDCFNIEDRDVTPVPGGVGLLTRVALLENAVLAAKIGKMSFKDVLR